MTNVTLPRAFEPVAAAIALVLAAAPASAGGEDRPVRGWLEHAHIEPSGISFDAKLDTGARTSSLHAEILRAPELQESELEVPDVGDPDLEDPDLEVPDPGLEDDAADAAETAAGLEATVEIAAAPPPASEAGEVETVEDETVEDEAVEGGAEPVVEEVEVDDEEERETIVFRITNEQGQSSTLQRTILRYVEIKSRDGGSQRRPVVEITACVAGVWVTGEVNLADREEFNYPFLVGRNMLEASGILVDSREIYTRSARCTDPAP